MVVSFPDACRRSLLLIAACVPLSVSGAGLDLAAAERIAIERDRVLGQLAAEAEALQQRAIAAGQRDDPRLRVGAVNVPVDSFDFDDDDMTMLEVGVSQEFAPGHSRQLARRQSELSADAALAMSAARQLEVRRALRNVWTELAVLDRSSKLVAGQSDWVEQLRRSARARYAAGEGRQLDLLRAGLDAATLRERQLELERESSVRHSELVRWLGPADAERAGPFELPAAAPLAPLAELERSVDSHPLLGDTRQRIAAAETAVEFEQENAKPGWMLDLAYGFRSGRGMDNESRSDMLSAMVTVGLPINRADRQHRATAAARAELRGLTDAQESLRRELAARLNVAWRDASRIDTLLELYTGELLPLSEQSVQAALLAWRNDRGTIEDVVEARKLALETSLSHVRLLGERAQAQHEIDYLSGAGP